MCKTKGKGYIRISIYIKWVIAICSVALVLIAAYFAMDSTGKIEEWRSTVNPQTVENDENKENKDENINDEAENNTAEIDQNKDNEKDDENKDERESKLIGGLTFFSVVAFAVAYVALSLGIFLSHRSAEDCRMHSLPILLSPMFLIIENGLLNLWEHNINPYYELLMGVFSATVVGIITFASLKFSFEISSQRNRFNETAKNKPNINITKNAVGAFNVNISENDCYLAGIYVGEIKKVEYWDIKKTGNAFCMSDLVFPNRKTPYYKGNSMLDISSIANVNLTDIIDNAVAQDHDVYAIFRDMQNYYYLARLPIADESYNVIGVNELAMARLVHMYCKRQRKNEAKPIKYNAMDWFSIPYNFHAS